MFLMLGFSFVDVVPPAEEISFPSSPGSQWSLWLASVHWYVCDQPEGLGLKAEGEIHAGIEKEQAEVRFENGFSIPRQGQASTNPSPPVIEGHNTVIGREDLSGRAGQGGQFGLVTAEAHPERHSQSRGGLPSIIEVLGGIGPQVVLRHVLP
jgi:hypothetical protein